MRTYLSTAALVALFAVSLVVQGCSSNSSSPYGSSPTAPSVSTNQGNTSPNTVLMSGMAFSPATITVAVGTTITWTNNDGVAHTSTSDTGVWDTGNIPAGSSKTTTFGTKGTFPYSCTYHAAMGMRGTVIVQ